MSTNALFRSFPLSAIALAAVMAGVVLTALAFEHIGGYVPCALCLKERVPYYAGVPLALFSALASYLKWPRCVSRGTMLMIAALVAYGGLLAFYHAGAEWHFWPGPDDCGAGASSGLTTNAGDLLGQLSSVKPPRCDEAALRIFGISFAGYNVLVSAVLFYASVKLALRKAD